MLRGLIPAHAGKTCCRAWIATRRGAHPRSRGENPRAGKPCALSMGSSPLTRGKRLFRLDWVNRRRLIPAHAGKTSSSHCRHREVWAHPRSRGENQLWDPAPPHGGGSSPLTRGKPRADGRGHRRRGLIPAHAGKTYGLASILEENRGSSPLTRGKRIIRRTPARRPGLIPAHAGKTLATRRAGTSITAHPRSRGENSQQPARERAKWGSSPLTRGKRRLGRWRRPRLGLIPAHAGKTWAAAHPALKTTAHPRSRGENHTGRWAGRGLQGSSPLTRGKRGVREAVCLGRGLIPAHAGKTSVMTMHGGASRAHPRSRGENIAIPRSEISRRGSSPLTRGKHVGHADSLPGGGLIPAHAGKTRMPVMVRHLPWAHPRSRGENGQASAAYFAARGSSPLTRGKLLESRAFDVLSGLIPAHAGKTRVSWRSCSWCGAHPRSRGENEPGSNETMAFPGSSPLTRGKRCVG